MYSGEHRAWIHIRYGLQSHGFEVVLLEVVLLHAPSNGCRAIPGPVFWQSVSGVGGLRCVTTFSVTYLPLGV